jgi:uncharacterized RDD family membrane protein YckC
VSPQTEPQGTSIPADLELATFGRKFAAFLLDSVLCALVAGLFTGPHRAPGNWSLLVFVVVYPLFTGLFTQSPGMRLLGLRCQGIADGSAIGLLRAFPRTLLLALLIPAVLTGPDGRPLHDRAVGSVVVRK